MSAFIVPVVLVGQSIYWLTTTNAPNFLNGYTLQKSPYKTQLEGEEKKQIQAPPSEEEEEKALVLVSPLNPVTIRGSVVGSYLESINTKGTFVEKIQTGLGWTPTSVSALDALYIGSGVAGILVLTASTPVALFVGGSMIGFTAIGLSEPEKRQVILGGIASTAIIASNPQTTVYVVKEAYQATKQTVNESVQLAKSAIGLGTTLLGILSSLAIAAVIVNKNKRKRL